MQLNYYGGNYTLIGQPEERAFATGMHSLTTLATTKAGGGAVPSLTTAPSLYNGNIASMVVALPGAVGRPRPPVGEPLLGGDGNPVVEPGRPDPALAPVVYGYHYDQLNRLLGMDAFSGLNPSTLSFVPQALADYQERLSYDAAGNITSLLRRGHEGGREMDELSYQYSVDGSGKLLNNRLNHVTDKVGDGSFDD